MGVGWVAGKGPSTAISVEGKGASRRFVFRTSDSPTFAEWGWQWAPWNPPFAGTDFTAFCTISIEFRLTGSHPPQDVSASLASPGDHCTTDRISLKQHAPDIADGKWHWTNLNLADFTNPKRRYDPVHTIQVIFGTWNPKGGEFVFEVKNIVLRS